MQRKQRRPCTARCSSLWCCSRGHSHTRTDNNHKASSGLHRAAACSNWHRHRHHHHFHHHEKMIHLFFHGAGSSLLCLVPQTWQPSLYLGLYKARRCKALSLHFFAREREREREGNGVWQTYKDKSLLARLRRWHLPDVPRCFGLRRLRCCSSPAQYSEWMLRRSSKTEKQALAD